MSKIQEFSLIGLLSCKKDIIYFNKRGFENIVEVWADQTYVRMKRVSWFRWFWIRTFGGIVVVHQEGRA